MTQNIQESNIDRMPIMGGKYSGSTPEEISDIDPAHIIEEFEIYGASYCSKALYLACKDAISPFN